MHRHGLPALAAETVPATEKAKPPRPEFGDTGRSGSKLTMQTSASIPGWAGEPLPRSLTYDEDIRTEVSREEGRDKGKSERQNNHTNTNHQPYDYQFHVYDPQNSPGSYVHQFDDYTGGTSQAGSTQFFCPENLSLKTLLLRHGHQRWIRHVWKLPRYPRRGACAATPPGICAGISSPPSSPFAAGAGVVVRPAVVPLDAREQGALTCAVTPGAVSLRVVAHDVVVLVRMIRCAHGVVWGWSWGCGGRIRSTTS